MAKQRYINTHFWDDNYIINLDPIEKLLFLYFLTNPLTNISGAYEMSIRRAAFDTGIDKEMILKILARFEKSDKMIYRDGWLLIVNFVKNQSLNPKIVKGIQEAVKPCPDWIKDRLSIAYPSLSIGFDIFNSNSNRNGNSAPQPQTPPKKENQDEYLSRKQLEYPHLDVQAIFKRYIADCKRKGIPPKRPFFDSWLDNEYEPLTADFTETSDLPSVDEVKKQREEFRKTQKLGSPVL